VPALKAVFEGYADNNAKFRPRRFKLNVRHKGCGLSRSQSIRRRLRVLENQGKSVVIVLEFTLASEISNREYSSICDFKAVSGCERCAFSSVGLNCNARSNREPEFDRAENNHRAC
jgi:hypothetical protein